ncbi:hypothetical protein HNY73_016332 [Argiope bruennichi]|uniref:Uncharacterized protein n=1 Tax=Argiope bruennichi TaxID=94029 RepID=A0A8T0EIH1_ARGBR|nr:hypothetical protein HNY73_016332 [Argiope bruennichi]
MLCISTMKANSDTQLFMTLKLRHLSATIEFIVEAKTLSFLNLLEMELLLSYAQKVHTHFLFFLSCPHLRASMPSKATLVLALRLLFAGGHFGQKANSRKYDPIEAETKAHSSKKYSKEYQKTHHHGGHKHKKHQVLDEPKKVDPEPKPAHADIPEPEIQLQSDIETSKKAIEEQKQKAEVEDLHLQDLTYEENLKKDKKKKKGHHHAENVEKQRKEKDQKLFADQEEKNPVEEKVIEDSFEPLKETPISSSEEG